MIFFFFFRDDLCYLKKIISFKAVILKRKNRENRQRLLTEVTGCKIGLKINRFIKCKKRREK